MQGRTILGVMVGAIAISAAVIGETSTVAPLSNGQIFIAEQCNHRIVRMKDMTGAGWTTFGSYGTGTNQFISPTGIFVNSAGQIYVTNMGGMHVTDPGSHRIVRINDMTGAGWTTFGSLGSGINQFTYPADIFVNARGQIFMADAGNDRIVRINDMTGAGWTTFGSHGSGVNQFGWPLRIFVSSAEQIYVADGNRLVRINDMTGTGWTTFGGHYDSVFVDSAGQIFVGEYSRIVRINDMTGAGSTAFGGLGVGMGESRSFCGPHIFIR